jgi:hypothetical protein
MKKKFWDKAVLLMTLFSFIVMILTLAFVDGEGILNGLKEMDWKNIFIALAVATVVYCFGLFIKWIVRRQFATELKKETEMFSNKLMSRLYIHEVIFMHRSNLIYPELVRGNYPVVKINTETQVKDEIKKVREHFRLNRGVYKMPLDSVENDLKEIYGSYYDEPNTNK